MAQTSIGQHGIQLTSTIVERTHSNIMPSYPLNEMKTPQQHNIAVYVKSEATTFTMEGWRQYATGIPDVLSSFTHMVHSLILPF